MIAKRIWRAEHPLTDGRFGRSSSTRWAALDEKTFQTTNGHLISELPRRGSLGDATIKATEPLVISDLASQPQFADNELVSAERRMKFFAGAPIEIARGINIRARLMRSIYLPDWTWRRTYDFSTANKRWRERLETLKNLQILDTPIEERFERITRVVCRSLNVPMMIDSKVATVTASIGAVYILHPTSLSVADCIETADKNLLNAKSDSRNRFKIAL